MKSFYHDLSRIPWLSRPFSTVAFLALLCSHSLAQDTAKVISFQGQLANQAGQVLAPTNGRRAAFLSLPQTVGGVAILEESKPNISVDAGRFSVLLGSRMQLPTTS